MTFTWGSYTAQLGPVLYLIECTRRPTIGAKTPRKIADTLPSPDEVKREGARQSIPVPDAPLVPLLNAVRQQILDPHHLAREAFPDHVARLIERTVKNIKEGKKPRRHLTFSRASEGVSPTRTTKSKTNAWKTLRAFLKQPEDPRFKKMPEMLTRLMNGLEPHTPMETEYQTLLRRKKILELVKHRIQIRKEWAAATMKRARIIQSNRYIPRGGVEAPVPPKPPLFRRKRGK